MPFSNFINVLVFQSTVLMCGPSVKETKLRYYYDYIKFVSSCFITGSWEEALQHATAVRITRRDIQENRKLMRQQDEEYSQSLKVSVELHLFRYIDKKCISLEV